MDFELWTGGGEPFDKETECFYESKVAKHPYILLFYRSVYINFIFDLRKRRAKKKSIDTLLKKI